ncbi:MAG: TetR family transcriptional regulator [Pseudonocardiaceae bacterium]
MDQPLGLRERKRRRTHRTISETAIALFLERGYDQVSIADIAAAAEVSRRTLFTYFPSKDDLVLHRIADHEEEAARVVRERMPGEAPLHALHRHLRSALDRRDPITGLCDIPEVVAFYRLVVDTPALASALVRYQARSEDALAAALREATPPGDPLAERVARLAAVQIVAVHGDLARANLERIAAGQTADAVAPDALAEADRAYELLRSGLQPYRA